MSKKSPPPKTAAEVERRRKIAETRRAYWASEEGRKVKERMAKERTGRQTEAHRKALADPENRRRKIEGQMRAAQRLLGYVPVEEEGHPGWVTDEERAVAAREGGGPSSNATGKNDPEQGDGPREGS